MINIKETLKKLHDKYPTKDLDELFRILDCIVEYPDISNPIPYTNPLPSISPNPWTLPGAVPNVVYCKSDI